MSFEIETKLSVAVDFEQPVFEQLAGGLRPTSRSVKQTYTTYFDTQGYDLLSCGAALRFRGSEVERDGRTGIWTLKFAPPAKGFSSRRFEFEIKAEGTDVPHRFGPALQVFGATGSMTELATLAAVRTSLLFADGADQSAIELDDDMVEVVEGPNKGFRFREIEVELLDTAFEKQAGEIAQVLLSNGASYAESSSKLEQAMDNPENHAFIFGLLDRYEHSVIAELSVLASLVLDKPDDPKVMMDHLADALLVGLGEESSRGFINAFVSKVMSGSLLYCDAFQGLQGLIVQLSIALAKELRIRGHGYFEQPKFPSFVASRISEIVLSEAALARNSIESNSGRLAEMLGDVVALPWAELLLNDEELAGFVGKWS